MLPTQRRQAILAQVRQHSAVSADDLARQFGVSVETIRRDLRRLGNRGLLDRVYGGAIRPAGRSSEGSFAARSVRRMAAKRVMAQLAASFVEPGDTVIIDVGTSALEVARALPAAFEGRVLTNSVPVAIELSARREIELLLCGGQVRPGDGACSGAHAEAFFAEFYADRAFLGSGGVHPRPGSPITTRPRWWSVAPSSSTPPPPTCWLTPASSASSPCTGFARWTASPRSSPTTRGPPAPARRSPPQASPSCEPAARSVPP